MSETELSALRKLREKTDDLSRSLVRDLYSFVHKHDFQTFVRLPTSEHKAGDVGVTVTGSCLMALALTNQIDDFTKKIGDRLDLEIKKTTDPATKLLLEQQRWKARLSFEKMVSDSHWKSSGLLKMNAFTSTLVLRTCGFLIQKGILTSKDIDTLKHPGYKEKLKGARTLKDGKKNEWSLKEVFGIYSLDPVANLNVGPYPSSPAVVYWYVDAIHRTGIAEDSIFNEEFWVKVSAWAAREFWKQRSLFVAKNDVLMDPIAMGMAACLCAKLREMSKSQPNPRIKAIAESFPSRTELDHGIELLFGCQNPSGIWNKYFPLFHYPDAGNNFCFTFEMLEAVLNDLFAGEEASLIERDGILAALERAVEWCRKNRLEFEHEGIVFQGWNSGGQISTLTQGKPESWATAVVHMFLWTLKEVLSRRIQHLLLLSYKAKTFPKEQLALSEMLDFDVLLENGRKGVIELLAESIVEPASKQSDSEIRKIGIKEKVSALLFGPPGTSKTETAKAIAKSLGWPLIEIDPSHFLQQGLESIYVRSDTIFQDLLDLQNVVVLFDEMDALVQTRDDADLRLDITSQFLTTSMLPKLAKLHDHRRIIFLMATNFQDRFDAAIKRAGRFDLLVCMWPPKNDSKLEKLQKFMVEGTEEDEVEKCMTLIRQYLESEREASERLNLFTFGEFKAFIRNLARTAKLSDELVSLTKVGFLNELIKASEVIGLRKSGLEPLKASIPDLERLTLDELGMNPELTEELKDKLATTRKLTPIIRYLIDRRQSKVQA